MHRQNIHKSKGASEQLNFRFNYLTRVSTLKPYRMR